MALSSKTRLSADRSKAPVDVPSTEPLVWYGYVRPTCATRQTVLVLMFVFVDTPRVGVGMAVLGAIGVGVLVLVLGVFVVVVVVRMAVRMIMFRPIGVRMRMGVIAGTHRP